MGRRAGIFIGLIALLLSSAAQNRPDSLLRADYRSFEDTVKVKHFWKLAKAYKKNSPDSARFYFSRALEIARRTGRADLIAPSRLEIAFLGKAARSPRQHLDTLLNLYADPEVRKHSFSLETVCLDLGVVYRNLSVYDKSVKLLQEAITLAEKSGHKANQYNALNSLANTYSQLGSTKNSAADLERALDMYGKAFQKIDPSKKLVVAMLLNNQGVSYFNLGQIKKDTNSFRKAIKYYTKSLELRKSENDSMGMADSHANIAGAYQELYTHDSLVSHLTTARSYYSRALQIDTLIGHRGYYSHLGNYGANTTILGNALKSRKIILDGISTLKKSFHISIALQDNYVSMITALNLGQGYLDLKMSDSALRYYIKYAELKDSLLKEENNQLAEELAAKYETELKDRENSNLREQAQLREEVIARKNGTIRAMVIGSFVLAALIFAVFISRQKIRKSKKIIEEQQRKTEEQKSLIEEKQKEILDSINYSKRLQDAAIPSEQYFSSLLPDSFIFYQPRDIVAGDFYWIHKLEDENEVLFAAADCTGHGVPGALVSIVCLNALNRCVDEYKLSEPAQILDRSTLIIQQSFRQSENDVKDGMDIALCRLNKLTLELHYAGANNPLLIFRNKELIEIKADKQPVGRQHQPQPFTPQKLQLQKGDTILLSTDGYPDQFGGEAGKKLKSKQFRELLAESLLNDPDTAKEKLRSAFFNWKGKLDQVDDVLVIGIRV